MIGTIFVVLVMVLYYRMAGALAVAALALYLLFTLGGLAMLDATLTLPGLAGLVLSIGIAVDANVLIFERIREELAAGKTVRLAIDEGFKHAMSAIIDSNVTTVLTGAVPLPVRYRTGEGLRGDADPRHRGLDDHRHLRHPDALPDLAGPQAHHGHLEHLIP